MRKITIIGDGAWGTAMAVTLRSGGRAATLWGHDPAYLGRMRSAGENILFLPGVPLPAGLILEADLRRALSSAELVVTAVPSRFLRPVLARATGMIDPATPVLSLTKGIDPESRERPSQVAAECLGVNHVAVLSGPSHAEEVARGLPASVVVASEDMETARRIQHTVSTARFRVYASRDVVGVEMAGAVKNIIALAAGIAHGLGLGDNALAALTTRGLAEMTRLGVAMGGDAATFSGLAGMGDLITTCVSEHGRNRKVGIQLARGESLDAILAGMNGVPESVTTTALALELARGRGVDMPITEQIALVLWRGKSPLDALDDLMNRANKDED